MNDRVDLVAGQNCPLSTTGLHVSVSHGATPPDLTVDVSAFLPDAAGKVAGDEDFIFFNQPIRSGQGVELDIVQSRFSFHLDRLCAAHSKIALALSACFKSPAVVKTEIFRPNLS